jgi:hypothetical protein
MTMTADGRTRPRLLKLAAGVTLAGVTLGLIDTGAVQAQVGPVDPPLNVEVTENPVGSLNVDWDAPTSGSPPTYYEVRFLNTDTGIERSVFTPSYLTEFDGFAAAPGTLYEIVVVSNNEDFFAESDPVEFTTSTGGVTGCTTAEWAPFCTVDAFIYQQYADWVDRTPTFDELVFWRGYLQPRDESDGGTQNVFLDMLRQEKDLTAGPVVRLYIGNFLRNPEYDGYLYWLGATQSGAWSMLDVAEFFSTSPEFVARYGNLDNAEFVTRVYLNVLGRAPDPQGFSFWTRQLDAGFSRGWMMLNFTEAPSQEFQSTTRIAVAVTEVFAEMLYRAPTVSEYNDYTFLMAGSGYPLTPAEVNVVYLNILTSAEYSDPAGRGEDGPPINPNAPN